MTPAAPRTTLAPADFAGLLSPYLTQGRREEQWRIDGIEIDGSELRARVCMPSSFVSGTDGAGFHLTIFTALEFASQLMIIYAHVWAGLERKVREGWMVESSIRSVRARSSASYTLLWRPGRSPQKGGPRLAPSRCSMPARAEDPEL